MKVFQRVVDEGGFAAAARALDMSPAGVTRLVSDLEQHLGVRLMYRTTRKLALTDAGESYLLRVRGILHEVEDAEAAAGNSNQELQGVLHVLATPLLANNFLAPQVANWLKRYPKVMLDLTIDSFPQARIDEFDVTFMGVDEDYDASVVARPLGKSDWIVCASPAYLKRSGAPLIPQELEDHDYLKFPWQQVGGSGGRRLRLRPLQGEAESVEIDMRVVLQSLSFEVLHRAVLDGAGITVLPNLLVAPHFATGELVHVLPEWLSRRTTIYAAVPSRRLIPARTRAFLAFVAESLPSATTR